MTNRTKKKVKRKRLHNNETTDVFGVVDHLSEWVVDNFHFFYTNIVTTGKVVGGIFLWINIEIRVE